MYTVHVNRPNSYHARRWAAARAPKPQSQRDTALSTASALIYQRARQTPEFAAGLAAARVAADAIAALPELEAVALLRAQGGWNAVLTAAFNASVGAATSPGSAILGDFPIASAVNGADLLAVRNAAIREARS